MKKKLISVAILISLLAPVGAWAATTTPPNSTSSRGKARADFEKSLEAKRAEVQNRMQAHEAELKAKLQQVRDEKKKTTVERIDKALQNLNKNMTTHYGNVLNQIEEVLNRLIAKVDKAQAEGKDVSTVRAKITGAQAAIASARTKVTTQAGKVYTINVTTDSALKSNVGATRKILHADLKSVFESVKMARDAVRQAIITMAQLNGDNSSSTEAKKPRNKATTTPTSTPTSTPPVTTSTASTTTSTATTTN